MSIQAVDNDNRVQHNKEVCAMLAETYGEDRRLPVYQVLRRFCGQVLILMEKKNIPIFTNTLRVILTSAKLDEEIRIYGSIDAYGDEADLPEYMR